MPNMKSRVLENRAPLIREEGELDHEQNCHQQGRRMDVAEAPGKGFDGYVADEAEGQAIGDGVGKGHGDGGDHGGDRVGDVVRSEEHTSALQSLMRISYAVFCLNTKKE